MFGSPIEAASPIHGCNYLATAACVAQALRANDAVPQRSVILWDWVTDVTAKPTALVAVMMRAECFRAVQTAPAAAMLAAAGRKWAEFKHSQEEKLGKRQCLGLCAKELQELMELQQLAELLAVAGARGSGWGGVEPGRVQLSSQRHGQAIAQAAPHLRLRRSKKPQLCCPLDSGGREWAVRGLGGSRLRSKDGVARM